MPAPALVTPPELDAAPPARRAPVSSLRRAAISAAASSLLHAAALVGLGWATFDRREPIPPPYLSTTADRVPPPPIDLDVPPVEPRPLDVREAAPTVAPSMPRRMATAIRPEVARPQPARRATEASNVPRPKFEPFGGATFSAVVDTDKFKPQLSQVRSPGQRLQAVLYRGGNAQSEKAVAAALAWLARHQAADGGWSFDHRTADCKAGCPNPGTLAQARVAATAMGLLPFLAAGETHKQGRYKKQVQAGLKFLIRNARATPHGSQLSHGGGTLYAQALATIALCESLAMTRDRDLIGPAQAAVNYIVNSQDPQGGGWRYFPGQPGDTSVTGWQVMALKSADNAYLLVPPVVLERARGFLDHVQFADGSAYGYLDSQQSTTASTAVGLLCRMALGWKRDHPALRAGVDGLMLKGVLPDNIYYDFYATQVLHHFGGEPWKQWNARMRDHLIAAQATKGHEAGSWFFLDKNPEDLQATLLGGRLYSTALAALTLEVYYRHLPLYGNRLMLNE